MKINLENKTKKCYCEIIRQCRRIQETAECVVPDVNDDIGKIASIQTSVYLKSKDFTGRGVMVTGEALAAVLYITEGEKAVSYIKLTKPFTLEFDCTELDADTVAQVKLDVVNTEARVLNPRKISLTFEIAGELSCYREENVVVKTELAPGEHRGIHAHSRETELVCISAAAEKTFTLSEQFTFPVGKPGPAQLVIPKVAFAVNDCQLIGTKLIVKGSVEISACYLSEEVNYPLKTDFSTPFSQIIDIGTEDMDSCAAMIELSSVYYDIVNTINGEKALDIEIHAVMQAVTRKSGKFVYISDVYSNLMPAQCEMQQHSINAAASCQQIKLISDERVSVVDDCVDVLSVYSGISQLSIQPDKISAAVVLDIIYRTKSGGLSSVRRLLSLSADCGKAPDRLINAYLADVYLRPDGAFIDSHIVIELCYLHAQSRELSCVAALTLDEEAPYDFSAFPTVTLVRAEKENIWELAKAYHSSVEQIMAVNQFAEDGERKMLLIPKSI